MASNHEPELLAAYFEAAKDADWVQVALNGGPPCFHIEDGRFCLRAERWDGHKTIGASGPIHEFMSLESLLRSLSNSANACEECTRLGWTNSQRLFGIEGRTLCWTHAQLSQMPPKTERPGE